MALQSTHTLDAGHARVEQRRDWLSTDLNPLPAPQKWCEWKAIGWVESQRHHAGEVSTESRYFITSLGDVEPLARRCVRIGESKMNCIGAWT